VRRGHISRFQPGTGASPQPLDNGKCMGCHAVNAQGTVLVADIDDLNSMEYPDGGGNTDPSSSPYGNWSYTRPGFVRRGGHLRRRRLGAGARDVEVRSRSRAHARRQVRGLRRTAPVPTGGSTIGSPTLPGSRYMSLAPVATGTVIATSGLDDVAIDPGTGIMMPAFSPDGRSSPSSSRSTTRTTSSECRPARRRRERIDRLRRLRRERTVVRTDVARRRRRLQPALHPGAWPGLPSFTPDSAALAFHAGTYTTGCNAGGCDDSTLDDGNLYVATLASGTPIRMAAADDPPDPSDANARSSRLSIPSSAAGMRGSCSRACAPGQPTVARRRRRRSRQRQATPLGRGGGSDRRRRRSQPPGHLPRGSGGHAEHAWFLDAGACIAAPPPGSDAGATCTAGFQCCSGFCDAGQCVNLTTVACAGVGGACTTGADCCNASVVSCNDGTCSGVAQ